MSDTVDFVKRLRDGDRIRIIIELGDEHKVVEGIVRKQWSNGTIFVGDFELRHHDYVIANNVMAIRYLPKERATK